MLCPTVSSHEQLYLRSEDQSYLFSIDTFNEHYFIKSPWEYLFDISSFFVIYDFGYFSAFNVILLEIFFSKIVKQ